MSNIVQYIIVRSDLLWPKGAIIAQCCHATAAVLHRYAEDPDTKNYLKDVLNMHKVVLESKDEASLMKLHEKLQENCISHVLWTEQPENIPTCIALKPYKKDEVHPYVKHFRLLK